MIQSNFYKIFSIDVFHSYFNDGICKGLFYNPSKSTEKIINRFSLKYVVTNTGFSFYSDTNKTREEFLNYIKSVIGEDSFTFNAITNNSSFYQFTDLPIAKIGVLKYTSNSVESSSGDNQFVLKSVFIPEQETTILFSITINFKDLIALKTNTPTYKIQFKARATQWKYFIINKNHQNLGQLSISNGTDIKFKEENNVTLQNGEVAKLFSLENQLLTLKEVPENSFDLLSTSEKNGTTRTKIIYKGLPSPNSNIMEVNTKPLKPIVSSLMYVYV